MKTEDVIKNARIWIRDTGAFAEKDSFLPQTGKLVVCVSEFLTLGKAGSIRLIFIIRQVSIEPSWSFCYHN